jgi:membrane fusion protein, multidrug efflux system
MIDPTTAAPRHRFALVAIGLIVVAAAAYGGWHYVRASTTGLDDARKAIDADAELGPRVVVATVQKGPDSRTISLLGDARPYLTTTIFAKVSGYLKSVDVDKGDVVVQGQKLAEIDSSELDAQYRGAVADLDYKRRLAARSQELLRTGNTPLQTAEQNSSAMRQAEELVRNLDTVRDYQTLSAPFAGTIIARYADPGALIQAATTNQASSLPVVQIADLSKLRVGVYVEQRDVPAIHVGDPAEVVDASNPDRRRMGRISRTAGALDPRTRTLYIEIDLDNHDDFLVPGSFTYVNLQVPIQSLPQIPVAALTTRGGRQMVAVVGEGNVVKFRPIRIGNTDGVLINVLDGVQPGERVALNVTDDVTDGAKVRAYAAK